MTTLSSVNTALSEHCCGYKYWKDKDQSRSECSTVEGDTFLRCQFYRKCGSNRTTGYTETVFLIFAVTKYDTNIYM